MQQVDLSKYIDITERFSYNKEKCIGKGTFGKVYLGWDKQGNRYIAVKIIPVRILKQLNGVEKR